MKSTEQLQEQMSAKENQSKENSSTEIIRRKPMTGTPFWIIEENGEYYGVLGKYKITEKKATAEDVEVEIIEQTWDTLLKVIAIFVESANEAKTKYEAGPDGE